MENARSLLETVLLLFKFFPFLLIFFSLNFFTFILRFSYLDFLRFGFDLNSNSRPIVSLILKNRNSRGIEGHAEDSTCFLDRDSFLDESKWNTRSVVHYDGRTDTVPISLTVA